MALGGERGRLRRAWSRLVAASPLLVDVGDRLRARLLASLLLVFIVAGVAAANVQRALVPDFLPAFLAILGTYGVLTFAYVLSRTTHYRLGGAIATLAVTVTSVALVRMNPGDPTWRGFLGIGLILGSSFLALRAVAWVAILDLGIMAALPLMVAELRDPRAIALPIIHQLVFAALVLVVSRHRERVEEARREVVLTSQAALAESQRLETLGRLAAGVAHDFRNILSAVSGNLELLRPGCDSALVDDMATACRRSEDIVRQLLAFASQQPTAPRPIVLEGVVREYEPVLRRLVGRDVTFTVSEGGRSTIMADRAQIGQVLLNLVINARDACAPGGAIAVTATTRVVASGAGQGHPPVPEGAYAILEVADDGPGIPVDQRLRIFDPFFTTKPAGSGLGLSTVRGIVERAGGHLTLDSTPGAGAAFRVYLPLCDAP